MWTTRLPSLDLEISVWDHVSCLIGGGEGGRNSTKREKLTEFKGRRLHKSNRMNE